LLTAAATGTLHPHLAGLSEAWRRLPLMLKKRRSIQGNRKLSDAEVRRLLRESSTAAAASIMRRIRDRVRRRLAR
jgi:hypothetical protein